MVANGVDVVAGLIQALDFRLTFVSFKIWRPLKNITSVNIQYIFLRFLRVLDQVRDSGYSTYGSALFKIARFMRVKVVAV
mgnify:CR=1 FL=1